MDRPALLLVLGLGLVACGDKPAVESPPPPVASASATAVAPPPPKAAEIASAKPAPPAPPVEEEPVPEPPLSLAEAKGSEAPSKAVSFDESEWSWFLGAAMLSADTIPFRIPAASKLRSPAARVALTKGLFPAVRALVATPWFAAHYANLRRDMLREKPRDRFQARTAGEIDQTTQAQLQAQIAAMEKVMTAPALGPTQQAELRRAIDEVRKQLAGAKSNPGGAEQAAREAAIAKEMEAHEAAELAQRKAGRALLEQQWPADPKQLVAKRIGEVLELTKDVDFGAQTKKNPIGQQRFVKDAYEAKPRVWKAAYRAGKPTVEACRAFALEWQRDLQAGKW